MTKSQETRKENERLRREAYQRRQAEKKELREALKKIAADDTATPSERLEAVKLILELDS